jgi:hypothetical protein
MPQSCHDVVCRKPTLTVALLAAVVQPNPDV